MIPRIPNGWGGEVVRRGPPEAGPAEDEAVRRAPQAPAARWSPEVVRRGPKVGFGERRKGKEKGKENEERRRGKWKEGHAKHQNFLRACGAAVVRSVLIRSARQWTDAVEILV